MNRFTLYETKTHFLSSAKIINISSIQVFIQICDNAIAKEHVKFMGIIVDNKLD